MVPTKGHGQPAPEPLTHAHGVFAWTETPRQAKLTSALRREGSGYPGGA